MQRGAAILVPGVDMATLTNHELQTVEIATEGDQDEGVIGGGGEKGGKGEESLEGEGRKEVKVKGGREG